MEITTNWQIAIFSVSVPLIASFAVYLYKKKTGSGTGSTEFNALTKQKNKMMLQLEQVEAKEYKLQQKKNSTLKELEIITSKIKLINDQSTDEYPDLTEWLTAKSNISKNIFDDSINKRFKVSSDDKNILITEIEIIIERLEVALADQSYNLLDNLYPYTTLKNKKIYKAALKRLQDEIPSSISQKSKSSFNEYINYAIEYINKKI